MKKMRKNSQAGFIRSFAKRVATVVLTCAVAMTVSVTGLAAVTDVPDKAQVEQEMKATANCIKSLYDSTPVGIFDYKNVIMLMRSGIECRDISDAYLNVCKESMTDGKILVAGNENLTIDAAVITILALRGEDPKQFNGADILKNFNDLAASYATADELNTAVGNVYYYEVIVPAVISYQDYLEDAETIKNTVKEALLLNYKENGDEAGIDYWGFSADNNGTVIPALNMFSEDADVQAKIEKAVNYTASLIMDDGGSRYNTASYSTESNADSTGLALKLYSELNKSEYAVKSFNGLMNFKSATTPGMYTYSGTDNNLATRDAFAGLVSYYMSINDLGTIYDTSAEVNEMYNTGSDDDDNKGDSDDGKDDADDGKDDADDGNKDTDDGNKEADDADDNKDDSDTEKETTDNTTDDKENVADTTDKAEGAETADTTNAGSMLIIMAGCGVVVMLCNKKAQNN